MLSPTTFLWQRFCLILRRDFLIERRSMLHTYLGTFFCFIFLFVFENNRLIFNQPCAPDAECFYAPSSSMLLPFWAFFFGLLGRSAMLFKDMNRKTNVVSYLTLPASTLEKYLSRITLHVLLPLIMLPILLVVSDYATYLFSWIQGGIYAPQCLTFISKCFFPSYRSLTASDIAYYFLCLSLLLSLLAFYVLGGTIFRKQPAILTFLVQFVIGCLLLILSITVAIRNYLNVENYAREYARVTYTIGTIALVAAIVCIYASYRIFKKATAIPPRFLGM